MSIFTYVELDYLTGERRLARIATIGAGGIELETTKRFRDGGIHARGKRKEATHRTNVGPAASTRLIVPR